MRKRAHYGCTSGCVACRNLLPDYRAHIIETNSLTEPDYLGPNRNDLVPAIVNRAGKLVAYVNAKTAAIVQYTTALVPDKIEVVDIILIAMVKTNLATVTVVL